MDLAFASVTHKRTTQKTMHRRRDTRVDRSWCSSLLLLPSERPAPAGGRPAVQKLAPKFDHAAWQNNQCQGRRLQTWTRTRRRLGARDSRPLRPMRKTQYSESHALAVAVLRRRRHCRRRPRPLLVVLKNPLNHRRFSLPTRSALARRRHRQPSRARIHSPPHHPCRCLHR